LEQRVGRFVLALLHTGSWLSELVSDLTAALPAESYPGEDPRTVVLAASRTLGHLQLGRDLSRRIHDGDDAVGRTFG
jgi:hypothetical protein